MGEEKLQREMGGGEAAKPTYRVGLGEGNLQRDSVTVFKCVYR